jgi:hypothetical protein
MAMTDDRSTRAPIDPADMSGIAEALEKLIPRSLDDIVRQNRHLFCISLATSEELAARAAKIEPRDVKDTISGWRMLSFRSLAPRRPIKSEDASGASRLSLLGSAVETGCVWITSAVIRIDADSGLVQTRNSFYRLGARAEGEPPPDELTTVCAALHRWGVGGLLGAPEFYF